MRREVVVSTVIVAMLVGSAGVGTAAPAGPTDGGDAVEHVSEPHVLPVDVTVDRTPDRPGHARVTYSMEVSQAVSRVVVALPESYAASRQSVTTDGFSQVSGEPRPVYEAIPTGRQTLSLTVEVQSTDVSVLGDEQYPMAYDTGSWAYFPDVFPFMRAVTESGTYEPHYRVQAGDGAVVENGAVFVGEYNETTRAVGGEQVHLVVPEGVSMASSETAVLDAVAAASERLPVGGRNDEVYAVALGYDRSEVNARGVARGNTMWAKADVPAGAVDNTWVHEYVHTRQAFETESELDWFVEGSAAYLDVAIPLMRGNGTPAEARRHLRGQYDGRLDDPDSWASQRIQYRRGGRAVALLNRLIVEASDGEQTVVTVFRELNSRAESSGRTLTGGDLRTAVIQETPADGSAWYRAYVSGDERIDISSPWAFVVSMEDDPDEDGLSNGREYDAGTEPFEVDTDGDDLDDGAELDAETDPTAEDTDGDGLSDGEEVERGLDPTATDTDGDGVPDGEATETPTATPTATPTPAEASTATATEAPTQGRTTAGSGPLAAWVPAVAVVLFALLAAARRR